MFATIIAKPIYDVIGDCSIHYLYVEGMTNSEIVSIYHRTIFLKIGRKTYNLLEIVAS